MEIKNVPKLTEESIIPENVKGIMILSKQPPSGAIKQMIPSLWEWAKSDDPELGAIMSNSPSTPYNIDTQIVPRKEIEFEESSIVVSKLWIDETLKKMSTPYYRMFSFPSHMTIDNSRIDFVFVTLVFGNTHF